MSLVKFHHRNSSTHYSSAAFRRKSSVNNSGFIKSLTVLNALLNNPRELNTEGYPGFDLLFEKEGVCLKSY